ncbi:bifunctional demethylmenaquinone methyltransferase/2-methoxy-6-polyprenyl-1,4-benzoquinol methylase UbiE [Candidatus Berkiella aquae]|uniref:Ubiquinone/menaquinone biosynthesis C-methyltransferase UbiE n=1 Tax=Candidatus Berkiella aquae TaxID=295108 RepID=A0A0Q9YMY8_9GAMM|nr:bifunctional demethylmenaquinone methyltransferase/2-methoxy-6-polyprenyl-1,4-benzoquinol methylase UbiE [Candidatus Berkiella aquae]MCS5712640.1 bifunctional demethylmenaquinone methyltransferase/2-methoxy-6-polyprenyl-1,4-benzoquinol methylase UbiE [Candidatus Berkiella aquae]
MKEDTIDFGFRKVRVDEKQKLVAGVFDSVASRYDIMNDLMSLGIHRLWKRHAISLLQVRDHHDVLDLACGSGDLSLLIAPKLKSGQLTLSDINDNMLAVAKNRLIDRGVVGNVHLALANAESLPFQDNSFDRIIIGFGLRNVTHKDKALASILRVLKPGGRALILEFSHPTSSLLSTWYDAYSFKMLPFLGKIIANDSESYRYLAESIRMHPCQESLKAMMLAAGFDSCHYFNLTGGIVAIHQGIKY